MNSETINVQFTGVFTIRMGERVLTENDIRSKKLVRLLVYLLLFREEEVQQQRLIDEFCQDATKGPADTLKNLVYRLRTALKKLGDEDFICTGGGGYCWNPEFTVDSDLDQLEVLRRQVKSMQPGEQMQKVCEEALALCKNDFSERFAKEEWFIPFAAYYQENRLELSKLLASAREQEESWSMLGDVVENALEFDSADEELHCWMIRSMCEQDRFEEAIRHYEQAKRLIYEATGVENSPGLQRAFAEVISHIGRHLRNIGAVLLEAAESEKPQGAYGCNYETFRQIYQIEARKSERADLPEGVSGYVILLTLVEPDEIKEEEVEAWIGESMDILGRTIQNSLRMGDVFSKCGPRQYIILLSACTFANGNMVANRIRNNYRRNMGKRKYQLLYELDSIKSYNLQNVETGEPL